MSIITFFSIIISISFSIAAQLSLKYGMSNIIVDRNIYLVCYSVLTNWFVLFGLFFYGMSMIFWLFVLTKVDVSKAYPFVGLGFIGTMFFAHFYLNESLTLLKLFGTSLVVLGVFLISKS